MLKLKNTNFTNTSAISINNIGISKTIAPNVNDSFGKKDFKYFISTLNTLLVQIYLKTFDLYVYCFQR